MAWSQKVLVDYRTGLVVHLCSKTEVDTLTRIHDIEVREKNKRLKEHLKRRTQLEEEFKKRGEELDTEKEAELKRLVDEGYNNPEKLARDLAEAFGIK